MNGSQDSNSNQAISIKRTKQACTNCRRKKARCSGERPICRFCARLRQPCSYEPYSSFQKTISASYKSIIAADSQELKNLRSKVAVLEAALAQCSTAPSLEAFTPPMGCDNLLSSDHTTPSIDMDPILDTSSYPSPGGPPSTLSEIPKHVSTGLTDTYFRFCHNQPYSYFHEGRFRGKLTREVLPNHLILAVFATALRFSTDPFFGGNQNQISKTYAYLAWASLVGDWDELHESPKLEVVQTMALLVVFDFAAGKQHSAWTKAGIAIRIAQALRLMLEPPATLSTIEQEEHRRTFWSVYLLDRMSSICRDMPCAIVDSDCFVRLPVDEESFRKGIPQMTPTIQEWFRLGESSFVPLGELAKLVVTSSVMTHCTRYMLPGNDMRSKVPFWSCAQFCHINTQLTGLECRLRLTTPIVEVLSRLCLVDGVVDQQKASQVLLAQLALHFTHCLLNHPLLVHAKLSDSGSWPTAKLTGQLFQQAFENAKAITEVVDGARNAGCNISMTFVGCCLTVAGGILIPFTQHKNYDVREEARAGFERALSLMQDVCAYWKQADSMIFHLKKNFDAAAKYRILVDNHGEGRVSLADMGDLWILADYAAMLRDGSEEKRSVSTESCWIDAADKGQTMSVQDCVSHEEYFGAIEALFSDSVAFSTLFTEGPMPTMQAWAI